MLLYPNYGETPAHKKVAVLASCHYCGERKRFDVCNPCDIRCNCKVHNGITAALVKLTEIRARKSDHKCDARCTNAKGPNCTCSCAGKNHGSDW